MLKFFGQPLDFIQYIGPRVALYIFCNISRLVRFEPKKLEHRVLFFFKLLNAMPGYSGRKTR